MVDDLDVATEGFEVRALVDAAQTMPFLTERRIVVGRGIGSLNTDQVGPLVAYLDQPLETTDLVLVAGGGRIPKALTDAVKRAGGRSRRPARRRASAIARRGSTPSSPAPASASNRLRRRGSAPGWGKTSGASTPSWRPSSRPTARAGASRRRRSRPSSARPATSRRGTSPTPSTAVT